MSNIIVPTVTTEREPSDAAWHRFGRLAAAALARLAEREAIEQAPERAA